MCLAFDQTAPTVHVLTLLSTFFHRCWLGDQLNGGLCLTGTTNPVWLLAVAATHKKTGD